MTKMPPGKLSGEPIEPARGRGKSRKAGLRIDFDSDVDPLSDLPHPPADPAAVETNAPDLSDSLVRPAERAGQEDRVASSSAPSGSEGLGGTAVGARPPNKADREAEAMAAARAAGVPPALARIEVTLTVEVGRRRMALAEILASEPGEVIALDRLTDEPVDILINGKPFARGEVVAVGESFGVRLLALAEPGEEP